MYKCAKPKTDPYTETYLSCLENHLKEIQNILTTAHDPIAIASYEYKTLTQMIGASLVDLHAVTHTT